jgi:hypothetical protein
MNDAEFIKKFPLGRYKSPFDPNDYRLATFMPRFAANDFEAPDTIWEFPAAPLDQSLGMPEEKRGHCPGFCLANFGINEPTHSDFTNQDAHDLYYEMKIEDGEPLQENGSCMRSVAKVAKNKGMIDAYAFAASVAEMKWWLVNKGPLMIGTIWTNSMFDFSSNNIIHIDGNDVGGHAYIINQIINNELFGIQNSWGEYWGINGKAYIPISEFTTLFRFQGECIAAVELEPSALKPSTGFDFMGCLKAFFAMFK